VVMGRAEGPEPLIPGAAARRAVAYTDADGRATNDPAAAVRGEIVEYDAHGAPRRRTRFFLGERELPWLPIGEPAFLLWVLVVLMVIWLVIGLVLLT
jgi:hypothetical protein